MFRSLVAEFPELMLTARRLAEARDGTSVTYPHDVCVQFGVACAQQHWPLAFRSVRDVSKLTARIDDFNLIHFDGFLISNLVFEKRIVVGAIGTCLESRDHMRNDS